MATKGLLIGNKALSKGFLHGSYFLKAGNSIGNAAKLIRERARPGLLNIGAQVQELPARFALRGLERSLLHNWENFLSSLIMEAKRTSLHHDLARRVKLAQGF